MYQIVQVCNHERYANNKRNCDWNKKNLLSPKNLNSTSMTTLFPRHSVANSALSKLAGKTHSL